ncbi:hypothetical protein DyAD56_02180 [Dyella sp. AD56]|uniref:hypothetical protein n=1 Tax=Dyella sp. AD56 TaxID=1528744 RepID=UPI000C838376|nr:hypothetical protein [Dyella sp. AD56]PMQ07554.1 hypothetical protein DyAD56_02180 [Dyella sp. AD56]
MDGPEFELEEVLDGSLLSGRNGAVQLPVGTLFNRVAKERVCEDGSHELVESIPVQIVVREVEIWRKSVPFAFARHSAGLRVDGPEMATLNALLQSRVRHEVVYLRS